MKKMVFPINYFTCTINAKAMFKGRHNLKWIELIIVFIFLNALLLIPIPFFYNSQSSVNVKTFMPNVYKLMNNKALIKSVRDGHYSAPKRQFRFGRAKILYQNHSELVGINLNSDQYNRKSTALVLKNKSFTIKKNNKSFRTMYQSGLNPHDNVRNFLLNSWYLENKGLISISMLTILGVIVMMINIFVIFGTAFILYLSHRSNISDINTYKEALNLTVNAYGLGCLIAMVFGLWHFNILVTILLPSVILVLMILWIYATTHFLDSKD